MMHLCSLVQINEGCFIQRLKKSLRIHPKQRCFPCSIYLAELSKRELDFVLFLPLALRGKAFGFSVLEKHAVISLIITHL
jgi:hypothetical protein